MALLPLLLSGCALFEPIAHSQLSVKPGTSAAAVFNCAEVTIRLLKLQQGHWSDNVTTQDVRSGLFETDRFSAVNVVGIRTQITYMPSTGIGRIKVKASGPYFVDLGAGQAAGKLARGIAQCL